MTTAVFAEPRLSPPPPVPARSKAWLPYSDAVRISAMLAVVTAHVADMILFADPIGTSAWWVSNATNALCRWAVPVYVMLSGSLWLAPERGNGIKEFYTRRFMRVGVPLLVWSPFYMLFSIYYTHWATPHDAWENLLRGMPYPHLHFVAVIAGLYLFTPAMRVFVAHADRGLLWLTVIGALALAAGNSVAAAATNATPNIFFRFVPFIGYYLAGYLLRDVRLSRRGYLACIAGAIACMLLLALATAFFAQREGKVTPYPSWSMMPYDFLSAPRIVLGILAWLILTNTFTGPGPQSTRAKTIIKELAACTFGIYLVHPAIRDILHCAGYTAVWPPGGIWVGLPLVTLMVYIPSVACVMIVRRIPYLRGAIG